MTIYQTCRMCKAVYFNKSWHHGNQVSVGAVKKSRFVWTTRCPACKMIESQRFEGLITITHIPARSGRSLLKLIREYTGREYAKNCQHRLIEVIKQDPQTWVITTTDNQLASRLALKIGQAFDHVNVRLSYSPEPSNRIRAMIEFLPMFYHRFNLET